MRSLIESGNAFLSLSLSLFLSLSLLSVYVCLGLILSYNKVQQYVEEIKAVKLRRIETDPRSLNTHAKVQANLAECALLLKTAVTVAVPPQARGPGWAPPPTAMPPQRGVFVVPVIAPAPSRWIWYGNRWVASATCPGCRRLVPATSNFCGVCGWQIAQ